MQFSVKIIECKFNKRVTIIVYMINVKREMCDEIIYVRLLAVGIFSFDTRFDSFSQ